MKVVCAACNLHYANVDNMEFAEMLVYSDTLALWHAPQCSATAAEHADALELVESIVAADTTAAREGQTP